MNKLKKDDFVRYKLEAVKAAEDFQYDQEAIEAIQNATSSGEICKIMRDCRIKKFDREPGVASDSLLLSRRSLSVRASGYYGIIGATKLG